MKLSKIFFGVAAAAMFAACSSDELVQEQGQPQWNADGTGYMAFSVAMPQAPASRAVTTSENDQFEDGLANEFEVKNMILVLFQTPDPYSGTTPEADAVFASAYDVTDLDFGMVTSSDNITSDRLIVKQITKPAGTGEIYAFVVLNNNGLFEVTSGNNLNVNSNPFTGTIGDLQDMEISDLTNNATDFHKDADNGFLMMNAPLYTAAGGDSNPTSASGKVQVLAPVTSTSIKGTKTEAQANVAAHVYVERAVAKVTMQSNTGAHTATAPNRKGFSWTLTSWELDNTNKKSYLVRNTKDADFTTNWAGLHSYGTTGTKQYRFVGSDPVAHNPGSIPDGAEHVGAELYRTYFAKDPNFSGTLSTTDYNRDNFTSDHLVDKFGDENPQYCAENTFNVANQVWNHTTRVVVKATLSGETLYGRPGDDGFFSADAIKVLAYNAALKKLEGELTYSTGVESVTGLKDWDDSSTSIEIDPASDGSDKITVKLAGLTFKSGTDGDALKAAYETNGVDITSSDLPGDIKHYKGGEAYYQARIKHFGDDLTPWNNGEFETGHQPKTSGVANIYPDGTGGRQNANYLGRWGMLRNNWYDLKVGDIKKLGEVKPGNLTLNGTTDDELEEWIAIDVNILSWARRAQTIDF